MKKLLALLVIGFLLLGCINPPPPPEQPTAYYGDNVTVDYILMVDGKILDTSIEQVARDNALYSPFRTYQPLQFTLLLGNATPLIPGFITGIVGMKVNETREVSIPPEDAYGTYDPYGVYNVSHYYNMSAIEIIPRSYFEGRNITVENGTGFDTDIGTVFIQEYNDENVTIMYLFQQGDSFDYNGFHHVVMASTNFTYTVMLDVRENGTYYTTSLRTGELAALRVITLTNETITFDENHALAGKTLLFNITLIDLQKEPAG
ncbi:FKBP-type peptidyl-prolyl cis-trans isomerase [Candidatus Micrarchaeota archaeon]|nr:FKBP-type peptidyl-prolyl cis-trans isomerase [Candidatus Micrarchaeota archaeon]